jgi:hypothetical protein
LLIYLAKNIVFGKTILNYAGDGAGTARVIWVRFALQGLFSSYNLRIEPTAGFIYMFSFEEA